MISDFICLEEMEGSSTGVVYMCSLPDPDLTHDDHMVLCGYVRLWQEPDDDIPTINIELLPNFEELCAGDTYQREAFVAAILDLIACDTGLDFSESRIQIRDFIGKLESVSCRFEVRDEEGGERNGS